MTETRPDTEAPAPPRAAGWVLIALIVLLGVLTSASVLIVIAAVVIMVVLHELGHYLTAKWAGMKVTEFFLGFGPKLWSFRRGETEYGVKPFLVGAYVRIVGMHNLEEVDPVDEPRSYRQAPYFKRLIVVSAGSAMHFLIALVLLFVLWVGYGLPQEDSWRVDNVRRGSPAAEAGLQDGDRLLAIDGQPVRRFQDLIDVVGPRPGDVVTVSYARDGEVFGRDVQLARNPRDRSLGFLGVAESRPRETVGVVTGVGRSFTTFGEVTVESAKALGSFFAPSNLGEYADRLMTAGDEDEQEGDERGISEDDGNRFLSPIGAVRLGADFTEQGAAGLFLFLVLINIFVGMINLVPLLPFDGGHVAIASYEKIRSMISGQPYRVDVTKMLPVAYAVVMVLSVIGITSLYLDLVDPISID